MPGIKFSLETAKYGGKGAMYGAGAGGAVPVIWMIKRRKKKVKKK